jgi:hypothetical protein
LRITPRGRFDEGFQVPNQGGIVLVQGMTATAGTANSFREFRHTDLILNPEIGPLAEFPHPFTDRGPRQTRGFGHHRHPTALQREGFRGGPLPSHPLVHQGTKEFELDSHGIEGG